MSKISPLGAFFAKYTHKFTYNPQNAPTTEYESLCKAMKWKKKKADYKKRAALRQEFGTALAEEFGMKFGTRFDSLESWQLLAKRIGIDPVPDKIEECRKVSSAGRFLFFFY
ncbi:hypothetical protein BDN70DRAFT_879153 [Pholiota conissans]|uniref:Uncharacterized protein n=1 Tax=Pholiota conissans TaxID=109636 RepID=A0A9P5Z438_9AGAR|nr:hypothetical protein BDN70DRAFT_879153 [Pholiota conissans]